MARGQLVIEGSEESAEESEQEINEAFAAFGLVADGQLDLDSETFALWPENLPTFNLWQQIQTQWRVGGVGNPTGLDYAGIEAYMRLSGIRKKDQANFLPGIQAMERATLNEWANQK